MRVQGSIQLDEYGMPEPDIVLLRPRPDYHAATAQPEDVLLLIEVADSSLEYDYGPKSEFYAAAGIPEFWIANLRTGEVEARTDPVGTEYTHHPHDPRRWRHYPTGVPRPDAAAERVHASRQRLTLRPRADGACQLPATAKTAARFLHPVAARCARSPGQP